MTSGHCESTKSSVNINVNATSEKGSSAIVASPWKMNESRRSVMQRLKVLSLEASNVLRLKAVQITPDPANPVVIIGGENEQGKSSVLACIEMAIGGKKRIPPTPVHRGARSGTIKLTLGQREVEVIVERTGEKLDKLVVRSADGAPQASPQAILDALKSDLSFDPLAFERMDGEKQAKLLRQLLGLDFTTLENQRAKLYEKRTEVGRSLKVSQTRVADFPMACVTAPDQEVDIGALLKKKSDADDANNSVKQLRLILERESATRKACEDAVAVAELALETARERLSAAMDTEVIAEQRLSLAPRVDTTKLQEMLTSAESVNRLVRAKRDREAESAKCVALEQEQEKLTHAIEAIDSEKSTRLAQAPWPVPGLCIDGDMVTFEGLPYSQASAARRR